VLEHPGTIKDPQKIKESWNAAYQGSTKLQDAGAFANTTTTKTEETSDGQNKTGGKPRQVPGQNK
jgi:hypothetical protein